jgi:hypothetical protein
MRTTVASLTEILRVRQPPGDPPRRWFTSDDLDLIVWSDRSGRPTAFQLCYDSGHSERALTWSLEGGFAHRAVDDGERVGGKYKATPILVEDGPFAANEVSERFAEASAGVPAELSEFVGHKLREHPNYVQQA